MTTEPTQDERLRAKSLPCMVCDEPLNIGRNYPPIAPVPRTLELWCPKCKVINSYMLTNTDKV